MESSNDLTIKIIDSSTGGPSGPSPPTTQNDIRYEGNLGSTASNSAIQFDVSNVGSNSARINGVRVTSDISDITDIWNEGSPGQFGYEIYASGGQNNGYAEAGNPTNFKPKDAAYPTDGSQISMDSNAVLSTSGGSSSATFFVGQLGRATGNNFKQYDFGSLSRVSSTDDWDVKVVLEFQNRGDVPYYFQEV
jgi:hypothetical protein